MRNIIIPSVAILFSAIASLSAAPQAAKEKAKSYPLKVCIVSDEALGGEMGDPVYVNYNGQTYAFCCKPCIKDFKKDPKKFEKKLKKLASEKKK